MLPEAATCSHILMMPRYMGLYGGLDVEGILAAVYQSVFGGDVYLSLEEKVANLLFNEIGNSQVV